jgi:hypothetical protein
MRRAILLQLCIASLLLATSATVRADVFGPISLVSNEDVLYEGRCTACEQVGYAHDPAISENGEYVAFDGYFDGETGVWRRNAKDDGEDAIEPVAVGEPGTPAGSAELPSISENGQYISFTTTAALSSEDTNRGPDVYVRNMEEQPTEHEPAQGGAYVLASAVNGSPQGLTYAYAKGEREEEERHEEEYGVLAAGRTALSAEGNKVVFVTTAASNLEGEATPETPPLEVVVRNLDTDESKVVSVEYDPATGTPVIEHGRTVPVPLDTSERGVFGAVYGGGSIPAFRLPEPFQNPSKRQVPASISADGTAVVWQAQEIGEQVPTLAEESLAPEYNEPLWRSIDHGEEAPTRRVTGGSDPTNPACIASGETALHGEPSPSDPCQGPFRTEAEGTWNGGGGSGDFVPRLSADGDTVAFVSTAPLVSLGNDFGAGPTSRHSDLYVADMDEGLSRTQALTPLTEIASGEETQLAAAAPIEDFAISPEGTQVAFTTKRTIFPLGSPAYVSAPAAVPGMNELFDVDLANDTLTRVTRGYEGGPSESPHFISTAEDQYREAGEGALAPSFSGGGGNELAFSSTASNLVFGDGNTPPVGSTISDGSDVFVVPREQFNLAPAPQAISSPPPGPAIAPPWQLWVTATSLADGSVRLYVEAPGAGTLRAVASGAVAVATGHSARVGRHGKGASVHGRVTVLDRDVAQTKLESAASAGGLTTLTLTLASSYGALATRVGGFSASASIAFAAPGHPDLHTSIAVSFVRRPAAKKRHAKASARSKARGEDR